MRRGLVIITAATLLAGCSKFSQVQQSSADGSQSAQDDLATEEARIDDLVSRMSLERKVAQLIQPQINSFTAEDMRRYRFGSYLNGGNGGPGGDEFAPALEWLRLADEMWEASTGPLPKGEPAIPTMWGTDAVHGHTNIVGATIFPHNIALGATRDADLVRRIGHATAIEIEVTGIDWNFSPTVAVAQDDRWGRTYESYSEDPAIVAELGAALVEGLQGEIGSEGRLGEGRVISTAKHFFGDGGTEQGIDQGDVNGDLDDLKIIHVSPYVSVIDAGVETVMASFNSINGRKMHGNEAMLTDVLRGELGFDGLVVGDWNGHGQVAGCTVSNCPQSLLSGLDIYMVPDDWKALLETIVTQVEDGVIPIERLDDAVSRVLRVKMRAGLLNENALKPSERSGAGNMTLLGSTEHRSLAREAVHKSQTILKNNGVLPLRDGAKILVAGAAANDIARASGGWTLTWQGGGELTNDHFPGATSIYAGIAAVAAESGGAATLSENGDYRERPDVAVVVFGERPYAEFAGDKRNLLFSDEEGLRLLRRFADDDIPTVAIFLSGRPLWVNRELNAADAFVASWLPGSEGAGVADILFGAQPATGRLSFSWPESCDGAPVNGPKGALFPFGYGLSLSEAVNMPSFDETCAALSSGASLEWFASGRLADGAVARSAATDLPQLRGASALVSIRGIDRNAQEDAREIDFAAGGNLALSGPGDDQAFRIVYEVTDRPTAPVRINSGESTYDATLELSVAAGKGWREMTLTKTCLPELTNTLKIESDGAFSMRIHSIVREAMERKAECSF
ncbi:MAG: glycoside hydrolase family 3 protein [Marinicaulis sp.]|nr:glycoside hydrolase family 3 protein [Marinicaulis sp.]